MVPLRGRALLASTQWAALRHTAKTAASARYASSNAHAESSKSTPQSEQKGESQSASEGLTGSAKLFADALEEESLGKGNSRDHLVHSQGPIWTGDESQQDAVLRMLVDKYKPLRTGEGVKADASEKRIHNWMKNLDMEPRQPIPGKPSVEEGDGFVVTSSGVSPHRTKLPPHLHRPWHATYTGDSKVLEAPKIKYGHIVKKARTDNDWDNLLELRLPPNADGSQRAKARDLRKTARLQGRLGNARESAIDYRIGVVDGAVTHVGAEEEEMEGFAGNRQIRGNSVLGAQRGGASGMRAWAGLVEDRITVSLHLSL